MAEFGSVGQFDAYTGFAGPYALHARSAGAVMGGSMHTPSVRAGHGVGGGVEPVHFGAGIGLAANVARQVGPGVVRAVKQRRASFSQTMNPAATGQEEQGPPTALPTAMSQVGNPASRSGSFQNPMSAELDASRAFRERMIATRYGSNV